MNGGTVSFRTVTGGGKTLAYILPTLVAMVSGRKGLTIVTGPLNFLQRDQYAQAIKLPILSSSHIALIDGDTTASDRATIFDKIQKRELHILFVGTAMLVRNRILQSALLAAEIELLVIITF
jgi:superfamily II DNA helicase RecQ